MSKTINDCIVRHISIESEDDLTEYSAGGYYLDVDIGDKVILCEDAATYMVEDDKAWKIYHKADFLDEIYKTDSYFDEPLSEEDLQKKSREAHEKFEMYCNAALKGRLDKAETKPYEPSFDYSNPSEVFKQFGENTKMDKEQLFESLLNEANIEVFPQDGKLQARNIGQQVVSSKTHDKTSGLDVKAVAQPLTRIQLDGTKAVIAYLKSQNKLNDISTQFDTNPHPDITFNGAGDAIITPDGGKGRPYMIPAEKLEPFYESKALIKESTDSTSSAFNLTKLKGYLRFETRWEYDEDYPEDAMLVDKVHEPPRFTVNWIGPEGKKHPNTYCVNIRKDRGESWTWITHFCLKASDAAEMINLEVGVWEHNNEPWRFGENKDALFEKLLEE
jgi:hypothetical protein